MSENNIRNAAVEKKQQGQMGGYARCYDLIMTLMTFGKEKKLRQDTIKLARINPGDNVLEIGCGTGSLTLAAKEQAGLSGVVTGIDIAPEMVAQARRKATRIGADVSFQEGSIADIPFPDNHFDVVMCSFMIFHMPDEVRKKGFPDIYRVLKPGGHLFILDAAISDKQKTRHPDWMQDVRNLAPVLKENAFTEIEMEKTPFTFMGAEFWFVRGKAEKS
jgi:ubiquinone/menaquinone biosynthesis C-methylase UbiE